MNMSPNRLWFIADTHFCHNNVMKWQRPQFLNDEERDMMTYAKREGATPKEYNVWMKHRLSEETHNYHNEHLIKSWNSCVESGDTVYHLGDFSLGKKEPTLEILKRLNGQIHLVRGNHDQVLKNAEVAKKFADVKDRKEIKVYDEENGFAGYQWMFLSHYCHTTWNKKLYGCVHLYGHSHGELEDQPHLSMDVGADTHNYVPYSYHEIAELMRVKKAQLGLNEENKYEFKQ